MKSADSGGSRRKYRNEIDEQANGTGFLRWELGVALFGGGDPGSILLS